MAKAISRGWSRPVSVSRSGHSYPARVLGATAAATLLVLSLPVWILIAGAIVVESRGGAFYRDDRVGLNGATFRMLKFRTMRVNCPSGAGKQRHDKRVTRVGRLLRRTSLDELPQLVHVVRGEMALVGPRPETTANMVHYHANHYARFEVLPGMTGLWQVMGRSDLNLNQKLELDLEYVRTRSTRRDLAILLRTPLAVLSCRGAF